MNDLLETINKIYSSSKLKKITEPENNKQTRYDNKEIKRNQKKYPTRMIFADDENQTQKNKFIEVRDSLQKATETYFNNYFNDKELKCDFKSGVAFNVSRHPWIMIYNLENSKTTSPNSTFILIDIIGECVELGNEEYIFKANNLKLSIGQGITDTKRIERYNNRITLVDKFKCIVGNILNNSFYYVENEDEDTGIVIRKDNQNINSFEKDLKTIVNIYLMFIEGNKKVGSDRNILVRNNSLDYVFDNYLINLEEKNYSLITFKPDYKLFLDDLGLILKKAISNPNSNYYLVIDRINKFPIEYLQELRILLNRNLDSKVSSFGINNSYLSNLIFKKEDKKIYLPSNLFIIATSDSTYNNEIDIENYFDKIN